MDPEQVYTIAVWTVPAGLIGARLYHVITDWGAFSPGHYSEIPQIWQGGLGIWGAVLGGMVGMLIGVRRAHMPFWVVADCVAPGLILAQALGRWGNYFNQELYGGPEHQAVGGRRSTTRRSRTTSSAARTPSYRRSCTSRCGICSSSSSCGGSSRRYWNRVPAGTIFALYVVLYSFGRLYIETLRIDTADRSSVSG